MSHDSDTAIVGRVIKQANKKDKQKVRESQYPLFKILESEGYKCIVLHSSGNELYQVRINNRLDIYPTRKRWHDTEKDERGEYENLLVFVRCFFFPEASEEL